MRPPTDYLHQGSHHFQYLSTTIWGGCINSISFLFRLIFPAGKERRNGYHTLLRTTSPECLLSLLSLDEVIVSLTCTGVGSLVGLHLLNALLQTVSTSTHGDILCACHCAVLDGLGILPQHSVNVSLLQISLTLEVSVVANSLLCISQCTGVLLALGLSIGNILADSATRCVA